MTTSPPNVFDGELLYRTESGEYIRIFDDGEGGVSLVPQEDTDMSLSARDALVVSGILQVLVEVQQP